MGFNPGKFSFPILAENSAGKVWSEVSTFSTGDFNFGKNSVEAGEMLLWLDASDIDADGDPIMTLWGQSRLWRDKSGNSRNAGNGNGPSLQVNRWNGLTTLSLMAMVNTFVLKIPCF